jgi:hypothetical protein
LPVGATCSHNLQEQVGEEPFAGLHRVAVEVGDAGLGEYLVVDVRVAGALARRAGLDSREAKLLRAMAIKARKSVLRRSPP